MTLKKILVPFDGSDDAYGAARFAARLAEATGAALHLIHVLEPNPYGVMGASALSPDKLQRLQREAEEQAFGTVLKTPELARLQPVTEVQAGKPSLQIVRYAEQENIDLIVMGSRGVSGIREFLLGSVSAQVIEHAPCSVTIVR